MLKTETSKKQNASGIHASAP